MVGVKIMKLYKDSKNKIHGFEGDGSQDNLITDDMVKVTANQVKAINKKRQQKHFDDLPYDKRRSAEYPSIADQLDVVMKWLATENEVTITPELRSMAMKCMSVKSRHPKPKE